MVRSLLSVTLILGAACAAAATPSIEDEYILWKDSNQGNALFLPEEVLLTTHIDQLPLGNREKGDLRAQAALYRDAMEGPLGHGKTISGCFPEVAPRAKTTTATKETVLEIARDSETVLLGRVTHVTVGWESWRRSVVEGVFIEVDQVLRGNQDFAGQRIGILLQGGVAQLVDGTICSEGTAERHIPKAGETVLVTGGTGPYDERFFLHDHLFPVYGDIVQPGDQPNVNPRAFRVSDVQAAAEGVER